MVNSDKRQAHDRPDYHQNYPILFIKWWPVKINDSISLFYKKTYTKIIKPV